MDLTSQLSLLGKEYEILLDQPYASVYYFQATGLGYIYWKRLASFEEYKQPFEAMLKKQKEDQGLYFISDIVNQGPSSKEKKEWFKEVALKQAIDGGLKKAAVILDNNPFKQFYLNVVLKATNTMGLPFKTFSDLKAAKEWLGY